MSVCHKFNGVLVTRELFHPSNKTKTVKNAPKLYLYIKITFIYKTLHLKIPYAESLQLDHVKYLSCKMPINNDKYVSRTTNSMRACNSVTFYLMKKLIFRCQQEADLTKYD